MPSLFFKPIQLNLELANLLIQAILFLLILSFTLLLSTAESIARAIQQQLLPAVNLARRDVELRRQLIDCLVAFDRLDSDLGLELSVV